MSEVLLNEGILKIQSTNAYWSNFNIRSLDQPKREEIIKVPLFNAVGTGDGLSKSDRAFAFDFIEKSGSAGRRFHIRGVIEETANYGSGLINEELNQYIQKIERSFLNPISLEDIGVVLQPGRLVNQKKRNRIYQLTELAGVFGRGMVDLKENTGPKTRRKKLIR